MVHQMNVGVQHELGGDFALRADYIRNVGTHFIIGRPIGEVFNPVVGGPDRVVNLESSVNTHYDALLVSAERRASQGRARVLPLRRLEGRDAVRDRLHPGQRRGALRLAHGAWPPAGEMRTPADRGADGDPRPVRIRDEQRPSKVQLARNLAQTLDHSRAKYDSRPRLKIKTFHLCSATKRHKKHK